MVFGIDGLVAAMDYLWRARHHMADTALGGLRNVFSALNRPKIFVRLQLFSATDQFPPAYRYLGRSGRSDFVAVRSNEADA